MSRRLWLIVGLVIFAVVDAVLIGVAISSTRSSSEVPERDSRYWTEVTAPTPSPSVAPPPPPIAALPPTRLLAAVDGETAWRASTGPCGTPATPEVTTDAGSTWAGTDASGPTGVSALLRLDPASADLASFVGLDGETCDPQFVRTWVRGINYGTYNDQLAGSWYLDPADAGVAHAPGGDVALPCSGVALEPRDGASAALLCSDGSVNLTTDAGGTWAPVEVPQNVVAVTPVAGGLAVASVGSPDCAGVLLAALPEAGGVVVSGCFALDVDPASLSGAVALDFAAGTLWMWAGDAVVRSADGGATWL